MKNVLSIAVLLVLIFENVQPLPVLRDVLVQVSNLDRLHDRDLSDEEPFVDEETDENIREEDLRKLILKKMRFRNLDRQEGQDRLLQNEFVKRDNDSPRFGGLVDRVAAMLHGMKSHQGKNLQVRMPSLRFG